LDRLRGPISVIADLLTTLVRLLILRLLYFLLRRWIRSSKRAIALVNTVSEVLGDVVVAQNGHTVLVVDSHGRNLDAAVIELLLVLAVVWSNDGLPDVQSLSNSALVLLIKSESLHACFLALYSQTFTTLNRAR